jgi:hypothetical protein
MCTRTFPILHQEHHMDTTDTDLLDQIDVDQLDPMDPADYLLRCQQDVGGDLTPR